MYHKHTIGILFKIMAFIEVNATIEIKKIKIELKCGVHTNAHSAKNKKKQQIHETTLDLSIYSI